MAFLLFFFLIFPHCSDGYLAELKHEQMVNKVNELRSAGCTCGREYMPPTTTISWNSKLENSAAEHAKDMYQKKYFSHYSKDGKGIGERISSIGYNWKVVGENIGEGQDSFDEVFQDWKESPTHCKMMMNPTVTEMGVARFKKYWVQHFATPLTP